MAAKQKRPSYQLDNQKPPPSQDLFDPSSKNLILPEDGWEEMEEEEEAENELSYEIFHPPSGDDKNIGTIIKDTFGFYKKIDPTQEVIDKPQICAEDVVHRYTLCNTNGITVQVITLGATIVSVRMPDNKSVIGDVVLGFDSLQDYACPEKNELSFGSMLGRFSSFISEGQFKIGKEDITLSTNIKGIHHEKGGYRGFDKALWHSYVAYDRVIMTHVSPDGDEGYPGTVMVQVSFQLTKNNRLIVSTEATTSKPTILSLSHNLYFNLAGHETGPDGLNKHNLLINADRFVKVNKNEKIPTGQLEEVGGTYFDLRVPRPVWKAIKKIPGGGYNHTFCLTKGYPTKSITFATRLVHPDSGRYLEITTDMPGLYINTGTNLPNPDALPPLEAQTGFDENMYPQFCREERLIDERTKELQNMMAAKQTWPREDVVPSDPEIIKALGDDVEEPPEDNEKPEVKSEKEDLPEKDYLDEEEEPSGLKFLRDEAESEEEEKEIPSWVPPKPIIGKKDAQYRMNGAVCLVPEEYPDCMKYDNFPKPILKPGETFTRTTVYKFGVIPRRNTTDLYSYL